MSYIVILMSFTAAIFRLSLKQGMGNPGIAESANRGIGESANRGIRECIELYNNLYKECTKKVINFSVLFRSPIID
jgi:hypothetical protein